MAFSTQKRALAIVVALFFFLCLTPVVALTQNPSQLPANEIRRRSGSPYRPVLAGPPRRRERDSGIPLIINNQCGEPLWPAIETQAGTGPGIGGFLLAPGTSRSLSVGEDWTGRVWGRTNCSFNANGTASSRGSAPACDTGDCGGLMSCAGPVCSFLGRL
jgi:Thaumatin family